MTAFAAFRRPFKSGTSLAVGDVNGDGAADRVAGAGAGTRPYILVFDGQTLLTTHTRIRDPFLAYPTSYRGGLWVAAGDLNRDGLAEIVASRAAGSPTVRVFNGVDYRLMKSFAVGSPAVRSRRGWRTLASGSGPYVAVGDYDGDGFNDVVTGSGRGAAPRLIVFSGQTLLTKSALRKILTKVPGRPSMRSGVRVSAYAVNGGGPEAILRVFLMAEVGPRPIGYRYSLLRTDLLPPR